MSRPKIKKPMKKLVRQKCYYGCVICGSPIVEYEHIEEWSVVKKHEESNLTLLCPSHHAEVTKKIIDKDFIKMKTKNPFNKDKAFTKEHALYFRGEEFKVYLGSSICEEHFFTYEKRIILVYAGNEVITARFEDNNLLFTVTIRDDFGQRIFQIIDNELTINTKMYDVENSKNKFIIRNDERIVLEVELITPATIKINRLFLRNGWNFFEIKHGDWIINGNRLSNLYSAYAGGAMFIIG